MKSSSRRGFTLVELIVVCIVVGLLAVMLMPIVCGSRPASRKAACMSNLKQIGTALELYARDYDDRLPPYAYVSRGRTVPVSSLLLPYLRDQQIWQCPEHLMQRKTGAGEGGVISYGYNWLGLTKDERGVDLNSVEAPSATIAFVEAEGNLAVPGPLADSFAGSPPAYRHKDRTHVLWLDGSVKSRSRELDAQGPGRAGDPLTLTFRNWDRKAD